MFDLPDKATRKVPQVERSGDEASTYPLGLALHRGRSRKGIVRVVPVAGGLYRVEWPDAGLSDITNLTRAKAAALEWAERKVLIESRNLPVVRRLKSLGNFSWSASPIRFFERPVSDTHPAVKRTLTGPALGAVL